MGSATQDTPLRVYPKYGDLNVDCELLHLPLKILPQPTEIWLCVPVRLTDRAGDLRDRRCLLQELLHSHGAERRARLRPSGRICSSSNGHCRLRGTQRFHFGCLYGFPIEAPFLGYPRTIFELAVRDAR